MRQFAVCGANGQALAYVYFEDEPGRRAAAKLLTKDEARRRVNIGRLPKTQVTHRGTLAHHAATRLKKFSMSSSVASNRLP